MSDGFELRPGALAAVGEDLGTAESGLGAAVGAGVGADAGASTALMLQVAGLQAEGMAALGQALGRSAVDVATTVQLYQHAENTATSVFPADG